MSQVLEYKGQIARLIFYWILINALIIVILFFSETKLNTTLVLLGIVNISYLASVSNRPFKIVLIPDQLLLEVHYLLGLLKKPRIVSLRELECSFNYEVRARGGKAKVLRIAYHGKTLIELLPDFNGWDEKSLSQIYENLNDLKKLN